MKKGMILGSLLLSSTMAFSFSLDSITKAVSDELTKPTDKKETTTSSLSNSTISSGLKEALKNGVDYAVKSLGSKDGYLSNELVKIPLPENLAKVETVIRKAGGDKVADDLINSMNNAATKAAPKTAEIFVDAIDKMSLEDAQKILDGGESAATDYFKTNTSDSLKKMIMPIIQETMKQNQVASYYETANSFYKSNLKGMVDNSEVMGLAKNFGVDSYLPGSSEESLDEYVTQKAIDGLFKMIETKEAAIRSNPIEQTTSILKQVFGN